MAQDFPTTSPTSRYSDTSSIFTSTGTFTSSSTVPGIGSLSGKAIKRLGSAVVNGVDAIIIRRRLAQLESALGQRGDDLGSGDYIKSSYSDLLELSRPVYSLSIRTRAFRLIMGRIGAVDFENLAAAVANWPLPETYNLLKSMFSCFRPDGDPSYSDIRVMRIRAYHAAGLDSYTSRLPYQSEDIPKSILCLAFVTFLAHTISLNFRPSLARLLVELDIIGFIKGTYPAPLLQERHTVQLLLASLCIAPFEKLDIDQDLLALTQLNELLTVPVLKDHYSIPASFDNSAQNIPELVLHTEQTLNQKNLTSSICRQAASLRSSRMPYFRKNKPNILLLGPSESGKSTLMKQIIRSTLTHSYSDVERVAYIEPILWNIWLSLREAVDDVQPAMHASGLNERSYFDQVILRSDTAEPAFWFPKSRLRRVLKRFEQIAHSQELVRDKDTNYYQGFLSRMSKVGYLPSDEDILRCYDRTKGIHPANVLLGGDDLCFYDVGGQSVERSSWADLYEQAGMVIFVAALSDYDEVSFEDPSVNRMRESLLLFDAICNAKWSSGVPIILFLNKTDVFAEKLPGSPLSRCFPDYKGGDDYKAAYTYIASRFVSLNRRATNIRVYLTNAIDTERIKTLMDDVHKSFIDSAPP